jgi:hypothetical protein
LRNGHETIAEEVTRNAFSTISLSLWIISLVITDDSKKNTCNSNRFFFTSLLNVFFVLVDVVIDKLFSTDLCWISRWVDEWDESTDPQKFVFEDIGIAAFLLSLWETERNEQHIDKCVSSSFLFSTLCFVDLIFCFLVCSESKVSVLPSNSSLYLNNISFVCFFVCDTHHHIRYLNSGSWCRQRIFSLSFDFSMCHHLSIRCRE